MQLPLLDTALWAAGPILNAALLLVLIIRRRLRHFPLLACWCIFSILTSVVLFVVFRFASDHTLTYASAYWGSEIVDALLQIGIVAEVARTVFKPLGLWKPGRRFTLILPMVAGAIACFWLVWSIRPNALTNAGLWEIRGELFTSLIISGMFTAVLFASQKLGLHWRSHVMSIGYGLMVWAITTISVGLLHGYWGTKAHYMDVEHARMLVYLCILSYWSFALWGEEPERIPLSPEMREAILQATGKVSYDLAKVLGTRGKELR